MDNKTALTIAIPTYNRSDSVRSLLDSVIAQLDPRDELLVVDDGSSDGTSELLSGNPRVRAMRHEVNQGMVKTWNACLLEARSDWVCIIHDDDRVGASAIRTLRLACDVLQEPGLVAHQKLGVEIDTGFRYRYRKPGAWAVLNSALVPSGVTVHKNAIELVGIFDERFRYSPDIEYFARVCARHPSLVVESPLIVEYVQHTRNYQYETWTRPEFLEELEAIERLVLSYAGLGTEASSRHLRSRMTAHGLHMLSSSFQIKDRSLIRRVGLAISKTACIGRRTRMKALLAAVTGLRIGINV